MDLNFWIMWSKRPKTAYFTNVGPWKFYDEFQGEFERIGAQKPPRKNAPFHKSDPYERTHELLLTSCVSVVFLKDLGKQTHSSGEKKCPKKGGVVDVGVSDIRIQGQLRPIPTPQWVTSVPKSHLPPPLECQLPKQDWVGVFGLNFLFHWSTGWK